jgi:hypothetical protein
VITKTGTIVRERERRKSHERDEGDVKTPMGPVENKDDAGWNTMNGGKRLTTAEVTDVGFNKDGRSRRNVNKGGRGGKHVNNNSGGGDHVRECESKATR